MSIFQNLTFRGWTLSKRALAPRFLNQLSRLKLLSGDIEEAIRVAKRSVEFNPNFIQNHLTLCNALLSAMKLPEAIEAINSGLCHVRNNPGKIWCLYFNMLAIALQRHSIEDIKIVVEQLVGILEDSPYFDPSGWDWETTQRIVSDEIIRLNDDIQKLIEDVDKLLYRNIEIEYFKNKWLKP